MTPSRPQAQCTILGAAGRMGQSLVTDVLASEDFALAAAVVRPGSDLVNAIIPGTKDDCRYDNDPIASIARSMVVIDVSVAEQVAQHSTWAAQAGVAYIVGITALDDQTLKALERAARHVPVLYAANFSLAVNLLAHLLERVSQALDSSEYDCDILDTHHRHKQDAPSGTAMQFAQAIQRGRPGDDIVYDLRQGQRQARTINFAVRRQGGITGEHDITFANDQEILYFSHRSLSRRLYTQGALKAARWLMKKQPGFYLANDWIDDQFKA